MDGQMLQLTCDLPAAFHVRAAKREELLGPESLAELETGVSR